MSAEHASRWMLGIPLALVLAVVLIGTGSADTYVVDDDSGWWNDHNTIQDGIDSASPGDTILVYDGTYIENVIVNKTVTIIGNGSDVSIIDGNSADDVVWINASNVSFSGFRVFDGGSVVGDAGIEIYRAFNVTVKNNLVQQSYVGILAMEANNDTIMQNNCTNNNIGLQARSSFDIDFMDNNISSSGSHGIHVTTSSRNILIGGNRVEDSTNHGIIILGATKKVNITSNHVTGCNNGVRIANSEMINVSFCNLSGNVIGVYSEDMNQMIFSNEFYDNTQHAIEFEAVSFSSIVNNTIIDNEAGIFLDSNIDPSRNVTIFWNTIEGSADKAIELQSDTKWNTVFMNNIIDNVLQSDDDSTQNFWDNEIAGNYWSDYSGNDTNGDGIGETPYDIGGSGGADDNFPLVDPWNSSFVPPNKPPTARIKNALPNPVNVGEEANISVKATDKDGSISVLQLNSSIDGSLWDGAPWESMTFNGLSTGLHNLSIVVRDDGGAWSGTRYADLFVNAPPTAIIDSISPGTEFYGEVINFTASWIDDRDSVTQYSWTSSVDGEFYNGSDNSTEKSDLSVGNHTIYLRVLDDQGLWSGNDTSQVTVLRIPLTYYVDDNWAGADHSSIQDAVSVAEDGDLILVNAGTYAEYVSVDVSVTIIGNGTAKSIIDGESAGDVVRIDADNVTFIGFTIKNSGTSSGHSGIEVFGDDCIITENRLLDNEAGVYASGAFNVTVINNVFEGCANPISVRDSHNASIIWNTITGGDLSGILVQESMNTFVWENNISECDFSGIWLYMDCDGSNVSANALVDLGIMITESENVTIAGHQFTGSSVGIEGDKLEHWSTHDIKDNTVNGRDIFYSVGGSDVSVPSNPGGIILVDASDTLLEFMNITGGGVSIELGFCTNITVRDSNLSGNSHLGLVLIESDDCTITGNIMDGNGQYGLLMRGVSDTLVYRNRFSNSSEYGLVAEGCTGLDIYRNEFWNNTGSPQAFDDSHPDNSWDNGSWGNHWTDYSGQDSDVNGIGDSSYSLDGSSAVDDYPLMTRAGPRVPRTRIVHAVWPGADFKTVGQAVKKAKDGDTIRIYAGTYSENVVVAKRLFLIGNGTSTVIRGDGNADVIDVTAEEAEITDIKVEGTGSGMEHAGIMVSGADRVVIRSVIITKCGDGLHIDRSDRVDIIETTVTSCNNGIYAYLSDNLGVSNATSTDNVESGFILDICQKAQVLDSVFSNNADGVTVMTGSGNNSFDFCSFEDNTADGIYIDYADNIGIGSSTFSGNDNGMTIEGGSDDIDIHQNYIDGNEGFGINAKDNKKGENPAITVNATLNWWGHDSGPFHVWRNKEGKGDEISDNVKFNPWLESTPNQPPTVNITSPTDGSTVADVITIRGQASDPDGNVGKVEIRFDSGAWKKADGTDSWSIDWDANAAGFGNHTISVRATDGDDWSDTFTITVTVTDESLTTPSEPQNLTASGSKNKIDLSWSAPESDGGTQITGYQIFRGDGADNTTLLDEVNGTTFTYRNRELTDGDTWYYTLIAVNSIGTGNATEAVSAKVGKPVPVEKTLLLDIDDPSGDVYRNDTGTTVEGQESVDIDSVKAYLQEETVLLEILVGDPTEAEFSVLIFLELEADIEEDEADYLVTQGRIKDISTDEGYPISWEGDGTSLIVFSIPHERIFFDTEFMVLAFAQMERKSKLFMDNTTNANRVHPPKAQEPDGGGDDAAAGILGPLSFLLEDIQMLILFIILILIIIVIVKLARTIRRKATEAEYARRKQAEEEARRQAERRRADEIIGASQGGPKDLPPKHDIRGPPRQERPPEPGPRQRPPDRPMRAPMEEPIRRPPEEEPVDHEDPDKKYVYHESGMGYRKHIDPLDVPMPEKNLCPTCDIELDEDARYCLDCGTYLG